MLDADAPEADTQQLAGCPPVQVTKAKAVALCH